ncbi:MAG TPA: hypothetical protein VFC47_11250 [Caulobacteraceae bacterium]|nr:hypothetical protein [Caulobacteraceae bacterium]
MAETAIAANAWVVLVAVAIQFAGLLIWGATLTNRVKQLEADMAPLRTLSTTVARIETRMDGLVEQLRDLNASIRWMRDPAPFAPKRRDFSSPKPDGKEP